MSKNNKLLHHTQKVAPYFGAILVCLVIFTYFSGINGQFVFDDINLIQNDNFYHTEHNPLKCWTRSFWPENRTLYLYRPVTTFSYWLDAHIYSPFRENGQAYYPPGFRLTNLLLHIIITLLVFKLALRLRFGRFTGFIAAALFAVHPIHVEAVTPAFGRGELLCALFLLSALILHTRHSRGIHYIIGSGICYMLAFMSKENGVAFLPLCIVMEIYLSSVNTQKNGESFSPRTLIRSLSTPFMKLQTASIFLFYAAITFAVFLLRKITLGHWLPSNENVIIKVDNILATVSVPVRVISAVKIHGLALIKYFWPKTLSYDYSYPQILPVDSLLDIYAIITLSAFFLIPALFIILYPRYKRKTLFLLFSYIALILPAGNFIIPAGTVFAERLQYLPSVILLYFASFIFIQIFKKTRDTGFILFVLALSLLTARTIYRESDWADNESLYISGFAASPKSVKVLTHISVMLSSQSDYKGALITISKAIDAAPDYVPAYINRALYYFILEEYTRAENDIKTALQLEPNNIEANVTLAWIYEKQGKEPEAVKVLENIQKHFPGNTLISEELKRIQAMPHN